MEETRAVESVPKTSDSNSLISCVSDSDSELRNCPGFRHVLVAGGGQSAGGSVFTICFLSLCSQMVALNCGFSFSWVKIKSVELLLVVFFFFLKFMLVRVWTFFPTPAT